MTDNEMDVLTGGRPGDGGRYWMTVVLLMLIAAGFGYWVRGDNLQSPIDNLQSPGLPVLADGRVMSQGEFQVYLKARKYYSGPIDNCVGTLTREAWDRAVNDQYGIADVRTALGGE